jgi:hypothetical protein
MRYIITEEQLNNVVSNNPERIIKLIERLIDTIDMEGVCDVKVYSEDHETFSVYVVVNPNWYLIDTNGRKNRVIQEIRKSIKRSLKSFLNLDVYVGSYVGDIHNC